MRKGNIEFYKNENGRIPVEEFMDKLPIKHREKAVRWSEGKIVLTNGFVKKSQKTPAKELNKARKYKKDYERRYCR